MTRSGYYAPHPQPTFLAAHGGKLVLVAYLLLLFGWWHQSWPAAERTMKRVEGQVVSHAHVSVGRSGRAETIIVRAVDRSEHRFSIDSKLLPNLETLSARPVVVAVDTDARVYELVVDGVSRLTYDTAHQYYRHTAFFGLLALHLMGLIALLIGLVRFAQRSAPRG